MEKAPANLELILQYFTEFTPQQLAQLGALEALYREWNEKINVISRKDIDGLYEKHVLHSLSIAAAFEFQPGDEVMDLGTGGGFPGIPLAILFPETKFHLVDSINKKLKVVQEVAAAAGLTNVSTEHTRAEDIKNRKFDTVVSRAVAPLGDLWRWSKPLIRKRKLPVEGAPVGSAPNGLICLKGGDLVQEIADSRCRPRQVELYKIFPEEFFREKSLLYINL
ncbi:MAG TPA: 16S rRNA (guanine(527)-N(7))-methyltransferase RsmG [Chitinophagaceae bacterium]